MSEGYGTTAGFKAYHTARARNIAAFDDDTAIDAARLVASEWLDNKFRMSFPGTKVEQRSQERDWPRYSAFDVHSYLIEGIPQEIEAGCYEAAYQHLLSPGVLTVDWTPARYKRAAVNGAVSVEYVTFNSVSEIQTQFVLIEQIIAPILTGCSGNLSMLSGQAARI